MHKKVFITLCILPIAFLNALCYNESIKSKGDKSYVSYYSFNFKSSHLDLPIQERSKKTKATAHSCKKEKNGCLKNLEKNLQIFQKKLLTEF